VSLETLREREAPPSHVHCHMDEEDFVITSSSPLGALMQCQTLTRVLPGRLGTFILPRDAIVTLRKGSPTTTKDVVALILKETTTQASTTHQRRLNHVTIELPPCDPPPREEDVVGDVDDLESELGGEEEEGNVLDEEADPVDEDTEDEDEGALSEWR